MHVFSSIIIMKTLHTGVPGPSAQTQPPVQTFRRNYGLIKCVHAIGLAYFHMTCTNYNYRIGPKLGWGSYSRIFSVQLRSGCP